MAQRFTNLLVGITLLVVLFTAYQTMMVVENMDNELAGQSITSHGITTERYVGEDVNVWLQRHVAALTQARELEAD